MNEMATMRKDTVRSCHVRSCHVMLCQNTIAAGIQ